MNRTLFADVIVALLQFFSSFSTVICRKTEWETEEAPLAAVQLECATVGSRLDAEKMSVPRQRHCHTRDCELAALAAEL